MVDAVEPPPDDAFLSERRSLIINAGRKMVIEKLNIGKWLSKVMNYLKPGFYVPCVPQRVGMPPAEARQYMVAYEATETDEGRQMVGFGTAHTVFILLGHHQDPQTLRTALEVARLRKKQGKKITTGGVKAVIKRTQYSSSRSDPKPRARPMLGSNSTRNPPRRTLGTSSDKNAGHSRAATDGVTAIGIGTITRNFPRRLLKSFLPAESRDSRKTPQTSCGRTDENCELKFARPFKQAEFRKRRRASSGTLPRSPLEHS